MHGLGERHWSLLALLAEHGALHTGQVVTLLFGSRPAAVRHLGVLARAGLVCGSCMTTTQRIWRTTRRAPTV